MNYSDLSNVLEYEVSLLDKLVYRLDAEYLLVEGNRHNYLMSATAEVNEALEAIKEAEIRRAVVSADVCMSLDLDPLTPLAEIADRAPEPWSTILKEQRSNLISLTNTVAEIKEKLSRMLAQRIAITEEVLSLLDSSNPMSMYGRDGRRSRDTTISLLDGRI
ncbi:MAG: flagellar export chaperone FlgN [Actinomycetota bacterium]|nr:flagellar export chaperone FlgN [Actinomycetota bacterium]